MLSGAKVAALLMLFGVALAAGEEVEGAPGVEDEPKQPEAQEPVKEGEGSKTQEKRGLFRVMGVHGENLQPYQFVYSVPQQSPAYQPAMSQYEPRALGSIPPSVVKPFPMPYAQPTYQPQYVINPPSAAPHMPLPYNTPTTMILLMMPPHHGNPYGSLMLLPYNNIVPQYSSNSIVPNRVPFQYVPQYVPAPLKGYSQAPGFAAAHYKASEYSQKPSHYLNSQNYQEQPSSSYQEQPSSSYQEQPASSEDQETVSPPPNYSSRRPVEYVKG